MEEGLMPQVGARHEVSLVVGDEHLAEKFGAPGVRVLGTPIMIGLMERAAFELAQRDAATGMSTVGVEVRVRHLAATPVGDVVRASAELMEVDGRRLVFRVSAYDSKRLIGEGTHERTLVNLQRFLDRLSQDR
jgi:fluoroacetyl-CoA thioesterase